MPTEPYLQTSHPPDPVQSASLPAVNCIRSTTPTSNSITPTSIWSTPHQSWHNPAWLSSNNVAKVTSCSPKPLFNLLTSSPTMMLATKPMALTSISLWKSTTNEPWHHPGVSTRITLSSLLAPNRPASKVSFTSLM